MTNRTFSPGFFIQGKIVQHTGPAINMSTLGHLSSTKITQADWTSWYFFSPDVLQYDDSIDYHKKRKKIEQYTV